MDTLINEEARGERREARFFSSLRSRVSLLLLCGLFCIFAFLHLKTSPRPWFDDGIGMTIARTFAETGTYTMQTAPGIYDADLYWVTTHQPVIFPVALLFKLFGVHILLARFVAVAYMAGVLFFAYAIIRRLSDKTTALWSAWLIATFSPFYGNGKALLGETPGIFWLLAGSWFWIRSVETETTSRNRMLFSLAAGTGFGLCAITKPYYLLILPMLAIAKLFQYVKNRSFKISEELSFGLPILGFLAYWFIDIVPKPITLEHAKIALGFFTNSYNGSVWGEAITFSNTILPNILRFFTESTPIHLLVLLGILCLATLRKPLRTWNPLFVFFGILILASLFWYIKTPGWYRYLYPTHLIVLMLAPFALSKITTPKIPSWMKNGFLVSLVAFQLLVTVKNINMYKSDALYRLRDTVQTLYPNRPIFVVHIPEASLAVEPEYLSQAFYINPTLTIGENLLLKTDKPLPDLVIASTFGGIKTEENEPILQSQYNLVWTQGRYRLFEKK